MSFQNHRLHCNNRSKRTIFYLFNVPIGPIITKSVNMLGWNELIGLKEERRKVICTLLAKTITGKKNNCKFTCSLLVQNLC